MATHCSILAWRILWIFIGKTYAEAEAPILWPPDVKNWLIRKDPDWGQEKWARENKMVGWHHWLNGHEFEQTPGDSAGQGSLARWGLGVCKSQTQLSNWTTATCLLSICLFLYYLSICLVIKQHKIDPFSKFLITQYSALNPRSAQRSKTYRLYN